MSRVENNGDSSVWLVDLLCTSCGNEASKVCCSAWRVGVLRLRQQLQQLRDGEHRGHSSRPTAAGSASVVCNSGLLWRRVPHLWKLVGSGEELGCLTGGDDDRWDTFRCTKASAVWQVVRLLRAVSSSMAIWQTSCHNPAPLRSCSTRVCDASSLSLHQ